MYLFFYGNLRKITPAAIAVVLILCLLNIFPCPARGNQQAIKIAAIFFYSGPLAEANVSSIRGARMAVREINTAGGLLGRRLELLEIDNLSTPIGSRMAALETVENNVAAIVGAAFSTHSIVIARGTRDHGIPMITNTSTIPLVPPIGDYVFRACYNDLNQGVTGTIFFDDFGAPVKSVVIMKIQGGQSICLKHVSPGSKAKHPTPRSLNG